MAKKQSGKQWEADKRKIWKKNEEVVIEIVDLGSAGEGIGRAGGYTLFVKGALPGEMVRVGIMKAKKNYGYARLIEIIQSSPDRIKPGCPVAGKCGGCQLQHCSYELQLLWKQEKIMNCLSRIGGLDVRLPETMARDRGIQAEQAEMEVCGKLSALGKSGGQDDSFRQDDRATGTVVMEPILGMEQPYHYRNKAQFPVGYDKEGNLVAGFYAGHTHQVIPQTDCLIQHSCNQVLLDTVLAFMERYQIAAYDENTHTGLVRHIMIRVGKATGQVMVCLVVHGTSVPHSEELVRALLDCQSSLQITSICLNRNEDKTNRILGDEVIPLYGQDYIEDCIGKIRYRISPLSFYQVNPDQTRRLYETALEYADLRGGETVWDLYCGIGTISLFLSQKAEKVYGVEIVPQAVENAKENARLNQIVNAEFYAGAAEDVVPHLFETSGGSLRADVVVLDPPRKGCEEKLLDTVVKMEPEKIVYVSCDPATLARDLKYLCGRGYALRRVRGCDMFGMSYHVETIVGLHRQGTDISHAIC